MSATITATTTTTTILNNTANAVFLNQQLMSWWSGSSGIAHGTRRPTEYPEWVTLEVAAGGFATSSALARLQLGDQPSTSFLTAEGFASLQGMLESGQYQIEHPENAALLVVVWLIREGRVEEAKALLDEIAPYLHELKMHPTATNEPTNVSSTVVAINTVADLRGALKVIAQYDEAGHGHRHDQIRRQRAVAEGYAELQADAIELLLSTVPDRAAYLDGEDESAFNQMHVNRMDSSARNDILQRAADLAQQFGVVNSHQRATSTTAIMLEAIRNPRGADFEKLSARIRAVAASRGLKGSEPLKKYLARTQVSAIPDQQVAAKANTVAERIKNFPQQSHLDTSVAVLAPINKDKDDSIATAGARRGCPEFPPSIVRAVRRAVAAPLEQLVQDKTIVSAEMIASVLPQMLSAAVGECIEDPTARRLYAQLASAFARRRSLLLLNMEKQVRVEELPWARPLLSLIKRDDTKQCEAVVKEAVRCFLAHYPETITPNRLVSALKMIMRTGTFTKANIVEELATDIFQNCFSPNFDAAALQASRIMKGTIYSRYYGLEDIYGRMEEAYAKSQAEIEYIRSGKAEADHNEAERLRIAKEAEAEAEAKAKGMGFFQKALNWVKSTGSKFSQKFYFDARHATLDKLILFGLATEKMADWQRVHSGGMYNTVQNGQVIEAAMVITTHNLAQLVDACGGMKDFDFRKAAVSTWTSIISLLESPPTNQLHGVRDIAYMWRQLLFYLSQLEGQEQQLEVAEFMKAEVDRLAKNEAVRAKLQQQFLTPLVSVINGASHTPDGKKVEDGAIVLGYYGWKPFKHQ